MTNKNNITEMPYAQWLEQTLRDISELPVKGIALMGVLEKTMKKFCKQAPLFLGWIGSVLGLYSICEVYEYPQWVLPVGMVIIGILYLCGLAGLEED